MTIKELIDGGLKVGDKLLSVNSDVSHYTVTAIGKNHILLFDGEYEISFAFACSGFSKYTEPKKKVTRWKWAVIHLVGVPEEFDFFYTEEEAKDIFSPEEFKKLEYTATEFEE